MSNVPHYPWFPDDYLSSPWVQTCTLAEEGVYRRLLDYQWKHPGCQLPDNIDYLHKLCKSGVRKEHLLRILEINFTKVQVNHDLAFWRNERLYVEFCKALGRSEKARESVKLRKTRPIRQSNDNRTIIERLSTDSNDAQSNDQSFANLPEPEPYPKPEPEPESQKPLSGKPDFVIDFSLIVEDLNKRAKTAFKYSSQKTRALIRARWNEGYRYNDFYKVHEHQCARWLNDPEMKPYLRPETLYGTKFESYLNAAPIGKFSEIDQWANEKVETDDKQ